MADYQCHPLWNMSPGEYGAINPGDLPISQNLQEKLKNWAKKYDETLNAENPAESGFFDLKEETKFRENGRQLAGKLRSELGSEITITTQL